MGMPDEHLEWVEDQEFVNRNRVNWNLRKISNFYEVGSRRPEATAYLIQTDSLYASKFS